MINTPDTPNLVVGQLKCKNSRFGAVIPGSYRIIDDFIFITFKVQRIKNSSTKSRKPVHVNIVYNMVSWVTCEFEKKEHFITSLITIFIVFRNFRLRNSRNGIQNFCGKSINYYVPMRPAMKKSLKFKNMRFHL